MAYRNLTILAQSDYDTILELNYNESSGVFSTEGANLTLSYRTDVNDGCLVVEVAMKGAYEARIVHKLMPGETILYRVGSLVRKTRSAQEWQTFPALA